MGLRRKWLIQIALHGQTRNWFLKLSAMGEQTSFGGELVIETARSLCSAGELGTAMRDWKKFHCCWTTIQQLSMKQLVFAINKKGKNCSQVRYKLVTYNCNKAERTLFKSQTSNNRNSHIIVLHCHFGLNLH